MCPGFFFFFLVLGMVCGGEKGGKGKGDVRRRLRCRVVRLSISSRARWRRDRPISACSRRRSSL